MRRGPVLIALAVAALAACGAEGTRREPSPAADRTAAATPASARGDGAALKRSFVAGANAACREYDAADEALPSPEGLDDYVPFMERFLEIGDVLQEMLEALQRPPEDAEDIEGWLEGSQRQTDVMRAAMPKIEAAVKEDDLAAVEDAFDAAIDEFNGISETLDPFARNYGIFECSNPEEGDAAA